MSIRIIQDEICVACGAPTISGEMLCWRCQNMPQSSVPQEKTEERNDKRATGSRIRMRRIRKTK